MTDNEKLVVPLGMHNIDALVSGEKHLVHSFCWESTGRISFVARISLHFAMGNEKLVVPIGIHDIDALVSGKKRLFHSFCWELTGRTSFVARIWILFTMSN